MRDTPFFRPPYGAHDARTDRIAADLGHPTITMWNGTLGDARLITPTSDGGGPRVVHRPARSSSGHANHPP